MNYFIFILAFVFVQDIPFKPREEFEIKLDYDFRPRPSVDHNTVNLGNSPRGSSSKSSSGVLPYLTLRIKLLSLPEAKMKMRIATNLGDRPVYRKVNTGSEEELELGFTDDMKDRVTPHEYILTFLRSDKSAVDCIVIAVGEDGSFLVNGEKRGRF